MGNLDYKSVREVALYEIESVPRGRKIYMAAGRSLFISSKKDAVYYLSNKDNATG